MQLGKDFFKWAGFIMALIKLLVSWFGDEEDEKELNNGK